VSAPAESERGGESIPFAYFYGGTTENHERRRRGGERKKISRSAQEDLVRPASRLAKRDDKKAKGGGGGKKERGYCGIVHGAGKGGKRKKGEKVWCLHHFYNLMVIRFRKNLGKRTEKGIGEGEKKEEE